VYDTAVAPRLALNIPDGQQATPRSDFGGEQFAEVAVDLGHVRGRDAEETQMAER
jgi:hypothetical protein